MSCFPFPPWRRRLTARMIRGLGTVLSGMCLGVLSAIAAPVSAFADALPLADGIYFYGQSPRAGVIGHEYFIFQVRGNTVKGAFFLPQSEFYCTTGQVLPQQLALSVADPYGEEPPSAVNIALVAQTPVAGTDPAPLSVTLNGYQAIADIGDAEQAILAACLQD